MGTFESLLFCKLFFCHRMFFMSFRNHLLKIIKNVFSFETFFVFFLFSYQFKNSYPFSLFPDITLFFTFILLPWFIVLYRRMPTVCLFHSETVSFLLFSFWVLLSSFWVTQTSYSISKSLCFAVYTIPSFFMAYFIIAMNDERLKRFFSVVVFLSIWAHLEAYKEFILSHWVVVDVLGNNYLVTGSTLGSGFILLTVFSFSLLKDEQTNNTVFFWLLMTLCGTYAYIQLQLGGRGPVIGVILTLCYFYINGFRKNDSQFYIRHFLYFIIYCVFIYLFLYFFFRAGACNFLGRVYNIVGLDSLGVNNVVVDESISFRLEYYRSAISVFLENPFLGLGFGGWALFHDTLYHYTPLAHDLREVLWRHPHNIGLEILSETGLIGALLGIWFGILIFRKKLFLLSACSFLDLASILLFIFSLFNALKSGDLNDNILLFVTAAIIVSRAKVKP